MAVGEEEGDRPDRDHRRIVHVLVAMCGVLVLMASLQFLANLALRYENRLQRQMLEQHETNARDRAFEIQKKIDVLAARLKGICNER